jgi:putative flippase GtrA
MLLRAARYFVVGGVSAMVDIGIFFVFAKLLGWNYLAVATVGFLIAVLVNYALSVRYVFTSGVRFSPRQELVLVYLVSAIGLAVHLLVLYAAVDMLGLELMLSKVAATASVFLWNFLARNYFVFRAPAGGDPSAQADRR